MRLNRDEIRMLESLLETRMTRTTDEKEKAVTEYAMELLENMENMVEYEASNGDKLDGDNRMYFDENIVLDGAENWYKYSEGGCSLIYNRDIIRRIEQLKDWEVTDDFINGYMCGLYRGSVDLLKIQGRYLALAWLDIAFMVDAVLDFGRE